MVMRSMLTIAVLAVSLTAVFVLGATVGADAKPRKAHVGSSITVGSVGPDGIEGRVSGKGKVCRAQRQVSIYRVNSGPSVPSSDLVSSVWTHGNGSWELPSPVYPGQYYAVVGKKTAVVRKQGRRVVCSPATSNAPLWG